MRYLKKGEQRNAHIRLSSPKMIEYFIAMFQRTRPSLQKEVMEAAGVKTKKGFEKKVTKMYIDDMMVYSSMMGYTVFNYFCDLEYGAMNIKSLSEQMRRDARDFDSMDDKLGKRRIFVYSSCEALKYFSLASLRQSSRFYLQNKDYKKLARNMRERNRVHTEEEDQTDYTVYLQLVNSYRMITNHMKSIYELSESEGFILRTIGSILDGTVDYTFLLSKCRNVMSEIKMNRCLSRLVGRKLIYRFGENEVSSYQLSAAGMALLSDCVNYVNEKGFQ